jgi:hypothetical protein
MGMCRDMVQRMSLTRVDNLERRRRIKVGGATERGEAECWLRCWVSEETRGMTCWMVCFD